MFYIAVLLMESTAETADYRPLYEETVVLLAADSDDHAIGKAHQHARSREHSYLNADGERITVRCKHVVDVAQVFEDELHDGAELYTRHFRDYAAYRAVEPLLSGTEL